jgi:hypothetical protein
MLKARLRTLFDQQKLAVVSTPTKTHPYSSLVAFVCTGDLEKLVIATSRNTTKYRHLLTVPYITVLIDDRENKPSDFTSAVAVTAFGTATEAKEGREGLKKLYISKHPYLEEFVSSGDCALIVISVDRYQFVSNFQDKQVLDMQ